MRIVEHRVWCGGLCFTFLHSLKIPLLGWAGSECINSNCVNVTEEGIGFNLVNRELFESNLELRLAF